MLFEKILFRSDMLRCLLCHDAPCSRACTKLNPGELLRSIWFDNEKNAAAGLPEGNICLDCPAPCEEACIRPHEVPVKKLIARLAEEV